MHLVVFRQVEVLDQTQQVALQHSDCDLADKWHISHALDLHEAFLVHVFEMRDIHHDSVGLNPLGRQSAHTVMPLQTLALQNTSEFWRCYAGVLSANYSHHIISITLIVHVDMLFRHERPAVSTYL
jgi:hypothetical protein